MSDSKLPIVTGREIVKILEKIGFGNTRKPKGSHFRHIHPDGRKTTVPIHRGKTISRGLLRKILSDIELSPEDFVKLRKR